MGGFEQVGRMILQLPTETTIGGQSPGRSIHFMKTYHWINEVLHV